MKTENYLGDGVVVEWWSGGVERLKTVLLARNLTLNYDSASITNVCLVRLFGRQASSLVEIPILRSLVEIPTRIFLM